MISGVRSLADFVLTNSFSGLSAIQVRQSARRLAAGALAALLVLGAGAASADPADGGAGAAWGLEALMRALSEVKHAQGRFVERKHLAILNAPLEFSGTLSYSAPGRLEKRTLSPEPATMVVDGERLVFEDGGENQRRTLVLRDHPAVWGLVESIRSTLAGDLALLRRFYQVRLEGGERGWRLLLTPLDAQMRESVQEIRLGGSGSHVTSVEVLETGGDRSLMTITGEAP